jgi:hypothetical protein
VKLYPLNDEEITLINAYRLLTTAQRQTYFDGMRSTAKHATLPHFHANNVICLRLTETAPTRSAR